VLTIYRRHRATCKMKGRRARCFCPIWVQGMLRGEAIRQSLDLTNWEAASKLVRDWEIEKPKDRPTIEDAITRFLADLGSRGLSRDTIKKFELLTGELIERFPGWTVDRFTPDDMAKFREGWKIKPSTASKKLERLRSFFKFRIDRDWIAKNPASGLRPPKETAIEKKPYDIEELKKIAEAVMVFPIKGIYGEENRTRIMAFISVLRWTGLRIRDVVQLRRSQVFNEYIVLRTHKNGSFVRLPLHPDVLAALEKISQDQPYIFWSGEGNPKSCVGDWQRTLRRLGAIAGVHIHAHRWRHTFAADLLSKGVPVSEVAAILGNSPRIVEKHYAQWVSQRQQALDAAVKGTWANR
jgi:integrase